jgi:hypothetical protein
LLDPSKTIVEIHTNNNMSANEILLQSEWGQHIKNSKDEKMILQTDKTNIPFLINYLVKNNIEILPVQPRHSLEDYLLSLTNPETNAEPAEI